MYVDLVVLLNFIVDFLLFVGTNRLSGFPNSFGRIGVAAAVGGIYGGICLLPGLHFLGGILWRLVFLFLMAWIAFGWNRSFWKRLAIFVLLSFALGGMASLTEKNSFLVPILCSVLLLTLAATAFGGRIGGKKYIPIEISHSGSTLHLIALWDTGNTLRDPVTGEDVLIIGDAAAEKLTGLKSSQLEHPLETLSRNQTMGLRLIPYHTVGQSGGFMLAKRFPEVRFAGEKRSTLVAFAPRGIGGDMYQALTGGNV